MDTKRFFLYFIVIAALALAGCGGNGGTQTVTPGPDDMTPPPPPPVTCTPPQVPDGSGGCMDPAPTGPTAAFTAFANGVVNPRVSGDPTTSRPSGDPSRPGGATPVTVTPGAFADTTATPSHQRPTTSVSGVVLGSPTSPWTMDMSASSQQLAGFASTTYTRGPASDRHTLKIFSDVMAPTDVQFLTYYDTDAGNRPGVASITDGVLTLDSDTSFDDQYGSLFESGRFPKNKQDNLEYASDTEFDGKFNGIEGKFTCTATCTASADEDGVLATLTGTWTFAPDESNLAKVKVPGVGNDADYLVFGHWIRERTFAGDNQLFDIGTFYAGSEPYTAANLTALTGSARYTGPAAGAYANKETSTSGEFTALADLTARFGTTNAISGTIGSFVDGGGESIDDTWTLTLETAEFGAATSFTGRTVGGGNWRGSFYGNPAGTPGATSYPEGVAGDFTGHFDSGHVIGAFGATR